MHRLAIVAIVALMFSEHFLKIKFERVLIIYYTLMMGFRIMQVVLFLYMMLITSCKYILMSTS